MVVAINAVDSGETEGFFADQTHNTRGRSVVVETVRNCGLVRNAGGGSLEVVVLDAFGTGRVREVDQAVVDFGRWDQSAVVVGVEVKLGCAAGAGALGIVAHAVRDIPALADGGDEDVSGGGERAGHDGQEVALGGGVQVEVVVDEVVLIQEAVFLAVFAGDVGVLQAKTIGGLIDTTFLIGCDNLS
ncbi:MAG: hypothetical protein GY938_03060 [Ketobacter sp.]|nr:hypothetical protein [Ketobacter sp.]